MAVEASRSIHRCSTGGLAPSVHMAVQGQPLGSRLISSTCTVEEACTGCWCGSLALAGVRVGIRKDLDGNVCKYEYLWGFNWWNLQRLQSSSAGCWFLQQQRMLGFSLELATENCGYFQCMVDTWSCCFLFPAISVHLSFADLSVEWNLIRSFSCSALKS